MRIYLESYGCTLNHGEARYLKSLLISGGHTFIDKPERADIAVLFTCCVIGTTELKMVKRAKHFASIDKPLLVSGCMAVVERDALSEVHPNIRFVEPRKIYEINNILTELSDKIKFAPEPAEVDESTPSFIARLAVSKGIEGGAGELEEAPGESIDSIVPIATGCRGRCTYCITRLARGELRSYPMEKIVEDVTSGIRKGHFEVRFTAQDTGCYGYDVNNNLAVLLDKITSIDSDHDFRLRVGMMNPDSVQPILEPLIKSYKHPRVFKFLHLPVQSGDDELLAAMGRRYTVDEFLRIVNKFRGAFPELTLSTDFIVGYPGESDEQFENSLKLLERLRANIVNITRFSARPGTPAAKLRNKLPGSKVKSRSRKMTELRFKISKDLNEYTIGRKYTILVTECVKAGSVLGRTDNYQPVVIKQKLDLGSWVEVRITEATDSYLIAELVM
ncbi:tRNA (N(6)-L-threonylcarbamoyladenosine(37)-C(2))-methylthiotransferase [[Eubacterium] cellulosolvens]